VTDPDAPAPFDSAVATRRGDDGTTGLLFGGDRIAKDDLRTDAYGTIDEAVAALGMARAQLGQGAGLEVSVGDLATIVLGIQRDLFVAAAELATQPAAWDRQVGGVSRVTAAMVSNVDSLLHAAEAGIVMPSEFVVPGETVVSAAIELARTIVRRAERRAVTLGSEGLIPGPHLLPYLNRLADLLWVLARAAEQAEAKAAPPSRPDRRRPAVTRST
jgi:cob(I)alamin adenosyltransferase